MAENVESKVLLELPLMALESVPMVMKTCAGKVAVVTIEQLGLEMNG